MQKILTLALGCLLAAACPAPAQIIPFDLQGLGGSGLLPTNEPGGTVGAAGTGGEIGAGIFFNTLTNVLTINVGWGTGNGFTNLTGPATLGHIHGPTPSVAPASFGESVGIAYFIDALPGWNPSATNGGFIGDVNILAGDVAGLFDGRFYLNFHTAVNGAGEIRGQLIPVPEPTSLALVGVAGALGVWRRVRRHGS
jgi:hypothetical protein